MQREVQNKQLNWSRAACPFLTDAAIDFLSRLLDRNEKTRLTAAQGEAGVYIFQVDLRGAGERPCFLLFIVLTIVTFSSNLSLAGVFYGMRVSNGVLAALAHPWISQPSPDKAMSVIGKDKLELAR